MRSAVAVAIAIALGVYATIPSAHAGETYMGLAAGPSAPGTGAFDARFDERGHAAVGFVWGFEAAGFLLDLRVDGAGYTVRDAATPADAVLMRFGGDVGKRVWLSPRVAIGASIGLGRAIMAPWTDDDPVADADRLSGNMWGLAARIEYVLGRARPPNPDYHGPINYFGASFVVEARRERLFLTSDTMRVEPTITLVTAGLRLGVGF